MVVWQPLRSLRVLVVGALALGLMLAVTGTGSSAGGPYYWIIHEHEPDKALQVNDHSTTANW